MKRNDGGMMDGWMGLLQAEGKVRHLACPQPLCVL